MLFVGRMSKSSADKDKNPTKKSDSGKGGKHGKRWFVLILLLIPVLYVLGIGPGAKLRRAGWVPEKPYKVVYNPLIKLSSNCKPVDRFLTWYVKDIWHCRHF
jgi:hypothetical protein